MRSLPVLGPGFPAAIMGDAMKELIIDDADAMHAFGVRLGALLAGGDLVMLDGPLGAGKTTLTRGIAEGMGVAGRVASPTFVIAAVHRSLTEGPDLVHVDAYRLESLDEVDALDLDASLEASATVVEWGEGKVEVLTPDRLTITIKRPVGGDDIAADCPRTLSFEASGERSREILRKLEARKPEARKPEDHR